MPSKAWRAFNANADDIRRLLEIHLSLGGEGPGRRHRLGVLNKSAIVLITAIWEAYCEDLASEALAHIVANVGVGADLPKDLKKRVAVELKGEKNELAVWNLADDGWKTIVKGRLMELTRERNRKLNTPKAAAIDELFATAIGVGSVSTAWHWHGMATHGAKTKLDRFVAMRGEIAHRGQATSVTKSQVEDYFNHVRKLVSKTGGRVNRFVRQHTGKGLW